MYNMLSVGSLISRDRPSKASGNAFLVPFSKFESSEESVYGFDVSDEEYFQDSVTRKRRHAVYYHRPPVWCPARQARGSSGVFRGSSCCSGELCSECAANDSQVEEDTYSCIVDCCDTTAALASTLSGRETNTSQSDQDTIILDWNSLDRSKVWRQQSSAERYTLPDRRVSAKPYPNRVLLQSSLYQQGMSPAARLQSYKDIRLGLDEKWAIHEGSLVICVDPAYTLSDRGKPRPDEFELVSGEIFVICRLYADLWALCANASSAQFERPFGETTAVEPMRLAFLPLCAVTLAANFSAFNQRCITHACYETDEPKHPGNGLPVMPPPRSYSLSDDKQIYRGNRRHIAFPEVVYDAFNRVSLEGSNADYVLADSPSLENVFSNLTDRGSRQLQRLGKRMSLRKLWSDSKTPVVGDTENRFSSSLGYRDEYCESGATQRPSGTQRRSSSKSQRLRGLIRITR
ncbi:uncharacterized protein BO80DRAFT_490208 [Aspergillus ibericus CBS 121593]|uniref:Uncharacterized protein n=1 Tax=Aspergillus ibericus CBS 121593 TaxID=1448316 RepID=A0A395HDT9_9EURO|nr:hypothetical protein BO80DRAFT_490208 [Aspergillus ibericus CBS 121593]RAL05900.1 hypothetical protein BO80DRAFT_490208 [Aspergillus ibericus CBS 121593]